MSKTIALVDDDRNILTGISMALEREGFKVQTYIDGESALIGLSRNPPDLAVVDIKMPKMDGEELLKKIRKKEQFLKSLKDIKSSIKLKSKTLSKTLNTLKIETSHTSFTFKFIEKAF